MEEREDRAEQRPTGDLPPRSTVECCELVDEIFITMITLAINQVPFDVKTIQLALDQAKGSSAWTVA